MVLEYAEGGSFNNWVNKNNKNFEWKNKILALSSIINGLEEIHQKQMVHRDFHAGNILFKDISSNLINEKNIYIPDMGLCEKVGNVLDKSKFYGVIPYIAPEVLRRSPYTQAADIYR
jgi:serine/threonine protein kinase